MKESKREFVYTLAEEIINAISHGVGAFLSVLGLIIGVIYAAKNSCAKGVVGVCVYGSTLILLYSMSTVYHALRPNKAKLWFRIFDHCSIFMLIAGSYTPIILCLFKGLAAVALLCLTWGVAVLGIVLNIIDLERFDRFSFICYLLMGWQVVFMFGRVAKAVKLPGILLLVAGGLSYTVGAAIYIAGKRHRYMHSVWHFFVLAGSILHYLAIVRYII